MATNQPKFNERSIDIFKSKLIGGGARANLFEVEIAFPALVQDSEYSDMVTDSRFLIKAAQLPASSVGVIDIPFRGRNLKIAGDRTFDPWTITVINDTNFRIRNSFEKWMHYINKLDDNAGVITPALYQADMKVHQLGRGFTGTIADGSVSGGLPGSTDSVPYLKSYEFKGCWPSGVSPIDLTYDAADTVEEFTVDLQVQWYDSIRYDSSGTGVRLSGEGES